MFKNKKVIMAQDFKKRLCELCRKVREWRTIDVYWALIWTQLITNVVAAIRIAFDNG